MILELTDVAVIFGMMVTLLTPVYSLSFNNVKKLGKMDTRLQLIEQAHYRIHKGD